MPTAPDRTHYQALIADVAAKAQEKLPHAVNGRVESAVKLVLAGDVFFNDDGTVEVGSTSDPMKTYTLAGHACDCQDFAYGKAPGGWCAHRIAAGIHKRVQELLAAQPPRRRSLKKCRHPSSPGQTMTSSRCPALRSPPWCPCQKRRRAVTCTS